MKNGKRKASATRNGTQDSVQPARKRARTALQYEHYYHDDSDNDDTPEYLSGTLPVVLLVIWRRHLAQTARETMWRTRTYFDELPLSHTAWQTC